MENENDILDTDIDEDAVDEELEADEPDTDGAEEVEDPEDPELTEQPEDAENEPEGFNIDDLEYDENGDIIIPDETAEEASSESVEEKEKEEEPARDPKDDEIDALKNELAALKSQSLDTLKKLGVDTQDAMDGLASLAAETANVSKEEYIRQREEEKAKERADAIAAQTDYEQIAANDLAELQAKYPETKAYKHVKDMPAEILRKFARNRDLGLSAEEAYAAANPDGIRQSVATSVKREVSGKEHLQSNVPKGSNKTAVKMSRAEFKQWREMFPNKTGKEIVALYRKTKL